MPIRYLGNPEMVPELLTWSGDPRERLLPGWRGMVGVIALAGGMMLGLISEAQAVGKSVDGVVNLNTAPVELLGVLPGIGPSKARGIVAYRERRSFRTVDELVRVKGIGRRMVRELRSHLAVTGPSTARATAQVFTPPISGSLTPVPRAPPRQPVVCHPGLSQPPRPMPFRLQTGREKRPVRSPANHCAPPA